MISIQRITDPELIKSLLEEDYDAFQEDGRPDFNDFVPSITPAIFYLMMIVHGEPAGLAIIVQSKQTLAETHVCILKKFRGSESHVLGKLVHEWVKENTSIRKFITLTPIHYKHAIDFGRKVGYIYSHVIKNSYKKNGKTIDLLLGECE